jgi:hypothetical protein
MRKTVLVTMLPTVLLSAPAWADAILTVGPAGHYATLQSALTAAVGPGTPSTSRFEVRVQQGTYLENVRLPNPCCGGRQIVVSGGWNATFNSGSVGPTGTIVDGRDRGRVIDVPNLDLGSLTLRNLTLREGYLRAGGAYGIGTGAGLRAFLSASTTLILDRVHVRSNTIRGEGTGPSEAQGAGAMILVRDTAGVLINDSRFQQNMTVQAATAMAGLGGGLHLQITDRASTTIRRTEFLDNWAYGSRQSFGGGLFAQTWQQGIVGLEDVLFDGNVVENANGEGAGLAVRAFSGEDRTTGVISRCRFLSHLVGRSQLHVSAGERTRVDVSDSLVAKGRGGVILLASHQGRVRLTNLTVADNDGPGITGTSTEGSISVFNTLAARNDGVDLALFGSNVLGGFNLEGVDPGFRPDGSYRLDWGSAAIDGGTNTPPAGLGVADLSRGDRVFNGTVDIGAYEFQPY